MEFLMPCLVDTIRTVRPNCRIPCPRFLSPRSWWFPLEPEVKGLPVEEMTSGEYDLTLFTCTYGGRTRVTVRCDRMDEN